jgi:cytochrome c-type biogenesis protein CcmH/NrfG
VPRAKYKFLHPASLYEKAVKINPKNITAWIRLARVCTANKEYLRAKEAIAALYRLGVDSKEVKYLETNILMNESGEYKDSWSELMQLMKKDLMETNNKPNKANSADAKSRAAE